MIQAYYLNGCDVAELSPVKGSTASLPEILVTKPGEYEVFGERYFLRKEGLYRFLSPPRADRQCIVFENDVFALLSSLCWVFSHGYRDNQKTFEEIESIACRGKVVLTCGSCSTFTVRLLQSLGVPARLVATRTLEDLNGYNDGHSLTEVKLSGRWCAYDPDTASLYHYQEKLLNIAELVEHARAGAYSRQALSLNVPIAVGNFATETYAYDMWYETALATEANRRRTMQRPLQVAGIFEEGRYFYTGTDGEHRRIEDLCPDEEFQYLAPDEFRARFYPEEAK